MSGKSSKANHSWRSPRSNKGYGFGGLGREARKWARPWFRAYMMHKIPDTKLRHYNERHNFWLWDPILEF